MLDLLDKLHHTSIWLLPFVTLITGLSSSLHCLSMCGGFSSSCSKREGGNWNYQFGRLLSYSFLVLLGTLMTKELSALSQNNTFHIVSVSLIGLALILSGVRVWFQSSSKKSPLPIGYTRFLAKLWGKVFKIQSHFVKEFLLGSLSALLPCGILYTVIIGVVSFNQPLFSLFSIFTFWVGTLPGLVSVNFITKKLFTPIASHSYQLVSIGLIMIGVSTISYRAYLILGGSHVCH